MEFTMIDLNGAKHEAIPDLMKERLLKKGWILVSENGEKLEPQPIKEVVEFISQCSKATDCGTDCKEKCTEEKTEQVIAETIEVEKEKVAEAKRLGRKKGDSKK